MAAAAPSSPMHAPSPKRRLRAMLSWLHLWGGLSIGVLFALVALAGSVLVFHNELLCWQHPQLIQHQPRADGRVLATLIERWQPQGLRSLDLPRDELPVWQGYFEGGRRAYFAPEDGALLLQRTPHDDVLLWLHEWHVELLGGKTGKAVLGVIGWAALCLLLIGLYLWWPKRGRWLTQLKMHANPPVRRWLTWHRSSGAMLLPLLVLATLTGTGMVYSNGFRVALTAVFGGNAARTPAPSTRMLPSSEVRLDWTQLIAQAQAALPDARISRLSVPKPNDGEINFRARADGEWHPTGRSEIRLDHSGRILQVVDATAQPLGNRMHQAIYPLHIGVAGGTVLRWLIAFTGLMPAFLLVTGFLFWRRRRGRR